MCKFPRNTTKHNTLLKSVQQYSEITLGMYETTQN